MAARPPAPKETAHARPQTIETGKPLMAGRLPRRRPKPAGPSPFTSAWNTAPPAPLAPPEIGAPGPAILLPEWLPGERTLSALFVLVLALSVGLFAAGREPADRFLASGGDATELAAIAAPTATPLVAREVATPAIVAAAVPSLPPATEAPYDPMVDGLLPRYRILTFYGHPHDENMGILGEHEIEEVHRLLLEEAERYRVADPSREVLPAFELIATVAQRTPGADGTYVLDTDIKTLTEWVNYASDNNLLVFLDIQIGRGSVAAELEKVRPLLLRPNVHLAIDPEFAVAEGQIPGEYIGSVWAESITYAQNELAALVAANNLPPKVVIVHQFREDMIKEKETLAPVPGVQLVIDADGFGDPVLKTTVYNILVRDQPVQFSGIKLFYKQDKPLMSEDDIVELKPSPDVVIYQ